MKGEIGTCKLCLRDAQSLQVSHLVPSAVYALCRAKNAPNPNPFLVTSEFSMQTSRQVQVPLLCFQCEQLLREKGEDWMMPELAQFGGRFGFYDKLLAAPKLHDEPDFVSYVLEKVPGVRVADLVHFFMGVFWKASVHPWRKGRTDPWLDLGEYSESIRIFLLGETAFPASVALSVTVLPQPVALISFHQPYETIGSAAEKTCHFYVCGFNATLWMGPNITIEIATTSIQRPPHYLMVVDNRDAITQKFRGAFAKSAARKQERKRR